MDILKKYVGQFNQTDEECYRNSIGNAYAYEWLKEEIPLFECPDEAIERTYYFRYWTYRKHVKQTKDGYVITEFLPKVAWSGEHNVINAAVGHHLYEGRWLKHGADYLKDYVYFFLTSPQESHRYSAWFADGVRAISLVAGCGVWNEDTVELLCRDYELWEETHGLPNGMFWSLDDRDAMEFSISGTTEQRKWRKGIRPTLNSYMCAGADAIAFLAEQQGKSDLAATYREKHERLKQAINDELFEDGFYRAYHYDEGIDPISVLREGRGQSPRELIGYIPWMFDIPPAGREDAFRLLRSRESFYTDFGPSTAEQSHERFLYEVNHECLWNGYVWPFATSQTLTALIHVIDSYPEGAKYRSLFCELLHQYAMSHTRTREDGVVVPWIDEVRHPYRDDWSSRTILKNCGWQETKGGYERGKDYNHSTFCDLVISGLVGIKTDSDTLIVKPCIPEDWEYFRLSNLHFRGDVYTITYDKTGTHYGTGQGLQIVKNT